MKEYTKNRESQSRTVESNSNGFRQPPVSEILQAYSNGTLGRSPVQRESIEEDDDLTSGQPPVSTILQQYSENRQRYASEEDEETLQGKFDSAQRQEKTNNTGLPDNLKSGIENLSGYSMDDVKVHYNSDKPAQLNALAYAQGTDIHVAPRQEKHLPHEAWHVVQQKQGRVRSTMQLQGANVNDSERLENEANEMGERAVRGSIDSDRKMTPQSPVSSTVSQLVVQRSAASLTQWIHDNIEADVNYNVTDYNGRVVVNNALEMSDAYWMQLKDKNAQLFKDILEAANALGSHNNVLAQIDQPLQDIVKTAQSSAGERLRFRVVIGPTTGETSIVEKYVTEVIKPLYSGVLPAFITSMDALGRTRLFDLPNAKRKNKDDIEALTWAIARNPESIPELVNYTEYYLASKGEIKIEAKRRANIQLDEERAEWVVADDDSRLPKIEAKLAKQIIINEINSQINYQEWFDKGKLKPANVTNITALNIPNVTPNMLIGDLKRKIVEYVESQLATMDLQPYKELAKDKLKEEFIKAREELLVEGKTTEVIGELSGKLEDEMQTVITEHYADETVNENNFWTKTEKEQKDAIKAKAIDSPIPFTAAHSAAYHALKHYNDIEKTEDRAAEPADRLVAYLESSRKTVANPATIEQKHGQFHDHPSFYFIRTVPAARAPYVGGNSQTMRAIVVVNNEGNINIATYFKA